MRQIVIACAMMEDEVNASLGRLRMDLPVLWLERGLHEWPARLHQVLQETIDRCDAETILLSYGLCGNALDGIGSSHSTLVAPRFHDCSHLFLSSRPGEQPVLDSSTLYFTDGYFRSERFLVNEYRSCLARYGPETTKEIYDMLLKNYRRLCLVDTGAFDLCRACVYGEQAASQLGLDFATQKGSLRVLDKLFSGQWDEEFLIIRPGERFRQCQFLSGRP